MKKLATLILIICLIAVIYNAFLATPIIWLDGAAILIGIVAGTYLADHSEKGLDID